MCGRKPETLGLSALRYREFVHRRSAGNAFGVPRDAAKYPADQMMDSYSQQSSKTGRPQGPHCVIGPALAALIGAPVPELAEA